MTTLITILILLGLIGSPEEYHSLSEQEKIEHQEIIIIDDMPM